MSTKPVPGSEASVCAVIVNFRSAECTMASLPHLMADLATLPAHVVIVDNNSGDGSEAQLREFAGDASWRDRVTVIQAGRNAGFGAGNNFAIHWARSSGLTPDHFLLINPDAYPKPGTCRALVDHLNSNSEVAAVGSGIEGPNGDRRRSGFRFPSVASEFEANARMGPVTRLLRRQALTFDPFEVAAEVDWVSGACIMLRATALDDVGLFDERFFLYFEEVDLCKRLKAAGWKVSCLPTVSVVHDQGSVTRIHETHRPRPRYWFESRAYFFWKHGGLLGLWSANIALISGLVAARLRDWLLSREVASPPHFLRDFVHLSFKSPD